MSKYIQHINPAAASQLEKSRADQVRNNAGGFVFALDLWKQLDRWLILGCEGGSYYASERKMTQLNSDVIRKCLQLDGKRTIDQIVQVSRSGRAPKNDPAIFALALAAADDVDSVRQYALSKLPDVCRIPTHLFAFVEAVSTLRGWGRSLRSAVAGWYLDRSPEKLAFQVVKYQQREGWSHRDVLRLCHASGAGASPQHEAIFRWAALGVDGMTPRRILRKGKDRHDSYSLVKEEDIPQIIKAYEALKATRSPKDAARLIRDNRMTHEMVPSELKGSVDVWDAILSDMPMTAMIRSLGKMTAVGLVKPLSNAEARIVSALSDREALKEARVHPVALLSALKVYSQGHGERGSLNWKPSQRVVDALDEAFYAAFDLIEPSGKRILLGLDVSASMTWGEIAGVPGLNPRLVSAAMSMATARSEKNWHVMGFSHNLVPVGISPKQRLDRVVQEIEKIPMGGTDCALPMVWARTNQVPVDAFFVYTDNETWAGKVHPFQALKDYRKAMGIPAKLVVVGCTATEFTIADPSDAGMLDVVGFDTSAPALMADFVR